jgi:hypothetical protein
MIAIGRTFRSFLARLIRSEAAVHVRCGHRAAAEAVS